MADLTHFNDWSVNLYCLNSRSRLDSDLYFSDLSVQNADDVVNVEAERFNNKLELEKVLPAGWVVETLGRIVDGKFDGSLSDLDNVDVVVKPPSGTQGDGVRFLAGNALAQAMREDAFSPETNGVVTRHYKLHDYSTEVVPWGSNTIRLLTYVDCCDRANLVGAVQKWATKHSGFIDNWSKGGITTWISNGMLMGTMEDFSPVEVRPGKGPHREPLKDYPSVYGYHPETKVLIAGTVIPFWDQVVSMTLEASEMLAPGILYAGWDVLVTPDGPVIIEVNPWPGVQLMQVHTPLLGDVRFREFLSSLEVEGV